MTVEIQYHVTIHWDNPKPGDDDELIDEIFSLLNALGNLKDAEINGGGAAWGPYLECWCATIDGAQLANAEVTKLLLEWGCRVAL